MRLLLCSDFYSCGIKYLNRFFDDYSNKNCLFIGYASENDENMFVSRVKDKISGLGFNIIDLTPNYNFNDRIDMIYSRGGNATKCLHLLRKYNQFEKVRDLVENKNALYVGQSAGSVIAGDDTEWTLLSEPYEFDLKKEFGKNALHGYGWVDKMVFVHCSKYRELWDDEEINGSRNWRVLNREFYGDYLRDLKRYKKGTYITLGNNQVYFVNNDKPKILTYDWSKIPVDKNYVPEYLK